MNDLNGLDWSAKPSNGQKANYNASAFATLRPTPPGSGRISPLPQSTSPNLAGKSPASATDSFSNLVNFSSNAPNKNLSLQEKQKKLADQKLQQLAGGNKALQDQFAGGDDKFWNTLGSGTSTPQSQHVVQTEEDEDDFLAAFNKPPKPGVPAVQQSAPQPPAQTKFDDMGADDDDPFGLSEFQAKQRRVAQTNSRPTAVKEPDDDDVLGLLGRPVSEKPPKQAESPQMRPPPSDPVDKAIAELVDMGFPAEKARIALQTTESGVDVQSAVGWLLNQAHSDARDRSRARNGDHNADVRQTSSRTREDSASQRNSRNGTPSNDPGKMASDLGANFMKSAGSFWKQAKKQAQQAMQDFNSDSDTNQPKWMRTTQTEESPNPHPDRPQVQPRRRRSSTTKAQDSVTDEALMLESSRPEKPARPSRTSQVRPDMGLDVSNNSSRDHSPAVPSKLRGNYNQNIPSRSKPQVSSSNRTSLNRFAAEEQASQAYVSSARRRKPQISSIPEPEPELLGEGSASSTTARLQTPSPAPQRRSPVPVATRPPPPNREVPSVSAISLKASHADREAGNEHFKRGDYASAHDSYSKALSHLPKTHPITLILLTNRALTGLKIGEPKSAIVDADAAILLIGISKGESERVDLFNGETPKPMRDYYGKALTRKAEALEHMEKWTEAAIVWREAVESGHGGANAIQGRMRAEKAANPHVSKPKPVQTRKPAATIRSNQATKAGAAAEAAAVSRLRAQNAAADKLDDEKFALSDAVDSKLNAWKAGKQDNLRALLGSLDTVLWSEAGWKKISMADLVLPNKVKIQYMKGIAKVHPDKIPTDASTEQRMIAGAVFSTLNEAWDKFKKENGL